VIVTDIASDPLWADFRELALSHDLYACWSTPIQGSDGQILGTFALYYREPHAPEADERELVSVLTYLASIAIARHRKEEERVQILQREREAREAAEAAVRVRDEFLSIASHELRTPATVIKGITQLWQRAAQRGTLTPDRLVQQIVSIRRASDRLNILINDLLDVSRLQSGQFALRKESLDLTAFVQDIAERHAEGADGTTAIELDLPDSPVEADADPTRLEQILDNLLTNAVKYSPEGQSIRVSLQRDGDGAVISVRDQGIGLPAGAADRIFEPFGRAENAVKRNLPGMGLGLYICRRIAELHGGRLWAESDGEDRGTILQLWLPRIFAAS
jgi:signal transduction histidine kinase